MKSKKKISNHIILECVAIYESIDRTQREIDLLNEYRTRLFSDVVTGKLDVREAAAALPEVDPLAANDEHDEALDAEADIETMDDISEEDEP